jgi:hypothetical protein
MNQPLFLRLARTSSIIGGLLWACLPPVFVYADRGLDRPATAGFALAAISMWLVGVVSLLLLLLGLAHLRWIGRDRVGPIGRGRTSRLGTRPWSDGLGERHRALYTMMTRGTESDLGHTIFLIAFFVLIVALVLVGQAFVRRRWNAGVRWAGLLLLLALPLGVLFLILGGA